MVVADPCELGAEAAAARCVVRGVWWALPLSSKKSTMGISHVWSRMGWCGGVVMVPAAAPNTEAGAAVTCGEVGLITPQLPKAGGSRSARRALHGSPTDAINFCEGETLRDASIDIPPSEL
jgi:hypothetical protein